MVKIFHFDTEGTGTQKHLHGIYEIGFIIEIDGQVKERHCFQMRPFPTDKFHPVALKMSRFTQEEIMNFPSPDGIKRKILDILSQYVDPSDPKDKFFSCGFNVARHDTEFLREWFMKLGDDSYNAWFWSAPLDTFVMAAHILRYERSSMNKFDLPTVAERFGIDVDRSKIHGAEYDADISREIYNKICSRN